MDLRRTRDRPPPRPVNSTTRSSPTTPWLTALLKAARRARERPLEPQVNAEVRWRGPRAQPGRILVRAEHVPSDVRTLPHSSSTPHQQVAGRVPGPETTMSGRSGGSHG